MESYIMTCQHGDPKRPVRPALLLAGVLCASGFASAQTSPAQSPQAPSGMDQPAPPSSAPTAAEGPSARPATPEALGQRFQALDVNGNRTLDEQEAQADATLRQNFDRFDTNEDGQISASEFAAFGADPHSADTTPREVRQLRQEAQSDPKEGTEPAESWFTAPQHKPNSAEGEPKAP